MPVGARQNGRRHSHRRGPGPGLAPRLRLGIALGTCALASGCGEPFVEGSLSAILDLHYDTVLVEASSEEVGVRYTRTHTGGGEDTVLRVTAKLDGVTLFPNIKFDLAGLISDGTQRGTVSRDVANDPHKQFPPLLNGILHLRDLPGATGSKVRGDFNLRFQDCIDFGCGYTAFDTFEGKVP